MYIYTRMHIFKHSKLLMHILYYLFLPYFWFDNPQSSENICISYFNIVYIYRPEDTRDPPRS